MSYRTYGDQCIDCAKDWPTEMDCFMVFNDIWKKAGLTPSDLACIECIEKRLGRELTANDHTQCAANYPTGFPGQDQNVSYGLFFYVEHSLKQLERAGLI